jgi:hypothetical protein
MNKEESDRWARHPYDPEPKPGDGPEYHHDWPYWAERERKRGTWVCVPTCLPDGVGHSLLCKQANWPKAEGSFTGKTIHQRKRQMSYDDLPRVTTSNPYPDAEGPRENPHNPIKFDVTIECTAAELAELEKQYHPKKVEVVGAPKPAPFLHNHGPGVR